MARSDCGARAPVPRKRVVRLSSPISPLSPVPAVLRAPCGGLVPRDGARGHRVLDRLLGRLHRSLQRPHPRRLVRHRGGQRPGEPAALGEAGRALQRQLRGDRSRCGPVVRVLRQTAGDQRAQLVRYVAEFGRAVRDPLRRLLHGPLGERGRPGRRVRQEQAQDEQVGRRAHLLALDLLGGEVAQPYGQLPALARLGGGRRPQRPERGQPGAVLGQQHRLRRQALEHGPRGVHPGEGLGQARAQYPYGTLGQRPCEADRLGERHRRHIGRGGPQPVVVR